jgi:hypothetical protein
MKPNTCEPTKPGQWAMFLLAFLLVAILVYGGAYLLLSEIAIISPTSRIRAYEAEWMEWAFTPGAKVESLLTGDDVVVGRFHPTKN